MVEYIKDKEKVSQIQPPENYRKEARYVGKVHGGIR
jgi:hypothetical protein